MSYEIIQLLLSCEDNETDMDIYKNVKLIENYKDYQWKHNVNIHILRNYTLENIIPFIKYYGYKKEMNLNVSISDYDSYFTDILDKSSELYKTKIDLLVFSLVLDNLSIAFDENGKLNVEETFNYYYGLIQQLKERFTFSIVINTFLPSFCDINLNKGFDVYKYELTELNQKIRKMVSEDGRLILLDFEKYVEELGKNNSLDYRYWFMFKTPFKNSFLRMWSKDIIQTLSYLKGNIKKVIVLDCDNTLWGGIVGEDGLEGIKLDPYNYPGNVYYLFQRQLLKLEKEGVLLAVCSKNNEKDAMDVINGHPYCLINEKNIVAWKINWNDKVENIKSLSQELNLGLDSFVFIDDSEVECEFVKSNLPMVDVLLVPKKIYELPKLLSEFKAFNGTLSGDKQYNLTEKYKTEKLRNNEINKFSDIDSFLASLNLEIEIMKAQEKDIDRIVQLIQKSNQFNLTTKRYNVGEIERFIDSDNYFVYGMNVRDKFGDYGLTGVAILNKISDQIYIDTFLMSCRILGRKIENVFLKEILKLTNEIWNLTSIKAEYIKTAKNNQVEDFYDNNGLKCIEKSNINKTYCSEVDDLNKIECQFIKVKHI